MDRNSFAAELDSRLKMASRVAHYRNGFSRIEVCVVLVTLGLLAAITIPAVQSARESARQTQCRYTLKQLALALHNYHDAMGSFPYGCIGNPVLPAEKRWSWYLCLGNHWGHYGTPIIDYTRPWDDPTLRPLRLHTWRNEPFEEFDVPLVPFPVIKCPNGTRSVYSDGQPLTDYVGTAGIATDAALLPRSSNRSGVWAYNERSSLADVKDGISTTLIAIETNTQNGCWLAGGYATIRDYSPDDASIGHDGQFGGLHHGGGMAVFVDGHVKFLADAISPDVLTSLLTIAGSETVADSAVMSP